MFSRYVSTVCCDDSEAKIHTLIGFHAHEENFTKYSSQFLRAIKTLRLVEDIRETLAKIRNQTGQQKKDMLSYIEKILMEEEDLDNPLITPKQDFYYGLTLIVCLIGIVSTGFIFYRKKKSRRKKRRRRKSKKRR